MLVPTLFTAAKAVTAQAVTVAHQTQRTAMTVWTAPANDMR